VQHRNEHKHEVQTLTAHEQSLEIVLATAAIATIWPFSRAAADSEGRSVFPVASNATS